MFADAIHGVEANANLYRLVETAKANGIEPWAYLERVFDQIPRAETLEDLDALLPRRIRLRNDGVNCVVTIQVLSVGIRETSSDNTRGERGDFLTDGNVSKNFIFFLSSIHSS